MAVPKQLRILRKLTAHLEEINPTNIDPATEAPYEIDLRGKVFRGRSFLPVDEAEDTLSILEFPRQELTKYVGEGVIRNDDWLLMLQGWPKDDPENPSDSAYVLKAICEKRLSRLILEKSDGRGPMFPDEFMLGEHNGKRELTTFTIAQGVVRPPEDAASRLAMFYMPLVLGVKMNVSDPY